VNLQAIYKQMTGMTKARLLDSADGAFTVFGSSTSIRKIPEASNGVSHLCGVCGTPTWAFPSLSHRELGFRAVFKPVHRLFGLPHGIHSFSGCVFTNAGRRASGLTWRTTM